MKSLIVYIESKIYAIKRRLFLITYNKFDPYPKNYADFKLDPKLIVENYFNQIKNKNKIKNFKDSKDLKNTNRKILHKLLKLENNLYCKEVHNQGIKINNGFSRNRIYLEFSKNRHAPIDVIIKNNRTNFLGIIICMQGDNSGAHLSVGDKLMPEDIYKLNNGSDIAIQAAELGFIAVSFERIGFGERRVQNLLKANNSATIDISLHLLMTGKTLLGETVNEICALSKWLIKKYNNKNLWLKGYSAAGTAAIYAAAIDHKNIKGIAVGGCLGPIEETILKRGASGFNHIPDMLEYFDMDSLISMIAPRPCIVISGIDDHIYPYYLSKKIIDKAIKEYKINKAENNLILIKAPHGHTYYPDLLWPTIMKFFR